MCEGITICFFNDYIVTVLSLSGRGGKETTREIEMIDWIEIGESENIERNRAIDKETHRNRQIERIRDRQKEKER